jgi:AcrR family transcriptional regulator
MPRPGGRSVRVRTAVFNAVEALLTKSPSAIPSMAAIAALSNTNPTTLYRRWGDPGVLATEVAIERIMVDHPIPDTGSLRGDLLGWATNVARSLSSKKNLALLRVLAASTQSGEDYRAQRLGAVARRGQELVTVLERAMERGEPTPTLPEVLELVLAPIYFRVLFMGPMGETDDIARLVDRACNAPRVYNDLSNAPARGTVRRAERKRRT